MAIISLATALTLASLAATGAGTAIQIGERNKAAKKQSAAIAQALRNQNALSNEKQGRLNKSLEEFSGESRQNALNQRANRNEEAINQTVADGRTEGLVGESGQIGGKFSKTFDEAESKAIDRNLVEGFDRAKRRGKFLAQGGSAIDEGIKLGRGAQDQAAINTKQVGRKLVDDLTIADAGRVRHSGIGAALKGLGTALSVANFATGLASTAGAAGSAGGTSAIADLAGASAGKFPAFSQQIFKPFKLALGPGF